MLKAVYIFIGAFLSLPGSTAVDKPTNVRLTSYNMDLVLKWDPPERAAAGVQYTAMLSSFRNITDHCVNVSSTQCDFTTRILSPYGHYTGWVKALLGDQSSDWVTSEEFIHDNETIIGPPNVTLLSVGTAIEVSIKDPEFAVSKLKEVYVSPAYTVTYWKDGEMEQARSLNDQQQDSVTLPDLEGSTRYCVQVQIATRNPRPSRKSELVCESTGPKVSPPWVAAVMTFFILAVVLALGVAAFIHRTSISHFLCPKDMLPSHLKEFLLAPPTSAVQVWKYSPPEEAFHQVMILTPDRLVEGGGRTLEDGGASCATEPMPIVQEEVKQEEEAKDEEEVKQEEEAKDEEEVKQGEEAKDEEEVKQGEEVRKEEEEER